MAALGPVLETIAALTDHIKELDHKIDALAAESYPETKLLSQVPGVGRLTALAYVLTVEDPTRFPKSRLVGSYLGLRPRQRDSGKSRPELRITKAGDELVRHLLVECAQHILGYKKAWIAISGAGAEAGRRWREERKETRRRRRCSQAFCAADALLWVTG